MRLLAPLALAALLAMPAPAAADPFSDHLDGVAAEVDAQIALLEAAADPADAKTLNTLIKVRAYLDKPSTSILKDLKAALLTAKALEGRIPVEYAGRGALLGALDAALDSFRVAFEGELSEDAAFATALEDPILGDKVQALLDAMTAALDAEDVAPDLASRVRYLTAAWRKSLSVDAFLARVVGRAGIGAFIGGSAFIAAKGDSEAYSFWVVNGPPLQYGVAGERPIDDGGRERIEIDFNGADLRTFPEAYDFTVAEGNLFARVVVFDAEDNIVLNGMSTSGRLVVQSYNPVAGTIRGTFEFTFEHPATMEPVVVSRGTFSVRDPRLKKPNFDF